MKYKALFSDVDGTLIYGSSEALPTDRVKQSIQKAQKKLPIGVATSRPFNKVKHITEYLGLKGLSIVSGGAQIVDVSTGEFLREYFIDAENTLLICNHLKNFEIRFWIQDNGTDFDFTADYVPHKPFVIVVAELEEQRAEEIIKSLQEFKDVQSHKVPSYIVNKFDIHITHMNASKYHALKEIQSILSINIEETVGVGDGGNDIPLLQACGLKVAMGNAGKELKALADKIVPSVQEDGVAVLLEEITNS